MAEKTTIELCNDDCRKIIPSLENIDAVVTDPPYGIGVEYSSYSDTEENWYKLMLDVVPELKELARFVVMPSCQIKKLEWWYHNLPPDWLIAWYKGSPGHNSMIGFNDWEPHVVWGRPSKPMHDYFQTRCGFEVEGHPCPKPLEWALWLVERAAPKGGVILDPFMGLGTVGVACVQTERSYIGIEIDKGYFNLAKERIEEAQRIRDAIPLF